MSQFSEDATPDQLSVVTPQTVLTETPQFSTAEYAHIPGTERCRICSNLISGDYYRINGQMSCATCAGQAQAGQPKDSHAAFLRGLLLGSGGALLGLVLYATVAIVTGWTIGYVALAVGWLVGKGIIKGSNGLGGRRYQITAVLLTYAAISMAAVPVGISYAMKHKEETTSKPAPAASSDNALPDDASSKQAAPSPKSESPMGIGTMLGQLLLYGLASPFLEFAGGNVGGAALGLFILFIGLRIAWTMTAARALDVDGPYSVTAA